MDVKLTMLNQEMTIMSMKKPKDYQTEEEMKDALWWTEQEEYKNNLKEWGKLKKDVLKDLLKVYDLLWSHCHISMHVKLSNSQKIKENVKKPDACVLWKEIERISNTSSTSGHPIMKMFDALYKLVCIRGNNYNNSADFFTAFQQKWELAQKAGVVFATPQLHDCYIKELEDNNQKNNMYFLLSRWKQSKIAQELIIKESQVKIKREEDDHSDFLDKFDHIRIKTGIQALQDKVMEMLYLH